MFYSEFAAEAEGVSVSGEGDLGPVSLRVYVLLGYGEGE